MLLFIVISAGVWTLLRLFVWPGHKLTIWGTIEAFAHIWVGFVVGALVFGPEDLRMPVAIALTVPSFVELVMFLLYKNGIYVR
jgi:hypothetical protein